MKLASVETNDGEWVGESIDAILTDVYGPGASLWPEGSDGGASRGKVVIPSHTDAATWQVVARVIDYERGDGDYAKPEDPDGELIHPDDEDLLPEPERSALRNLNRMQEWLDQGRGKVENLLRMRDEAIKEARTAGISPAQIMATTGLSRPALYKALDRTDQDNNPDGKNPA